MFRKFCRTANGLRRVMNLWPPLFFSGIQIMEMSEDYRYMKARLRNWPLTRNLHGAQFGGSLFAMTDAAYALMLNGLMRHKYYVWDKSSHIDFIKPGRGEVYIECQISNEQLAEIYERTKDGEKFFPEFEVRIFDKNGETVAIAKRVIYVRLKPSFRPVKPEVTETSDGR